MPEYEDKIPPKRFGFKPKQEKKPKKLFSSQLESDTTPNPVPQEISPAFRIPLKTNSGEVSDTSSLPTSGWIDVNDSPLFRISLKTNSGEMSDTSSLPTSGWIDINDSSVFFQPKIKENQQTKPVENSSKQALPTNQNKGILRIGGKDSYQENKSPQIDSRVINQFKQLVQDKAISQLTENEKIIKQAQAKYNYNTPETEEKLIAGLREAKRTDNELAKVQKDLEKRTKNLEILIGQGEVNYRVYQKRGNEAEAEKVLQTINERKNQLELHRKNLDGIILARAALLKEHPAIGVLKLQNIAESNSDSDVIQKLNQGFESLLSDITKIKRGILSGDVPITKLGAVVSQAYNEIPSEEAKQSIDEFLAREEKKERFISLSLTAVELGLTVAAFCTGGIPGLILGGMGTILGVGIAAYELERIDDLNRVGNTANAGGNELLGNPDEIRQEYILAWANLVLNLVSAGLDIGLTIGKGTKLLNPTKAAEELAALPNSKVLFRILREDLLKIQKVVDGDEVAKEALDALRKKYGADVDDAIGFFENSNLRILDDAETTTITGRGSSQKGLDDVPLAQREKYLEIIAQDIEKGQKLLEFSNFGSPERFKNVFNALDSVDDVDILKRVFDEDYVKTLSQGNQKRYQKLLDDIANGTLDLNSPTFQERLEVIDEVEKIQENTKKMLGEAIYNEKRLNERMVAYSKYEIIDLSDSKTISDSVVSFSGKGLPEAVSGQPLQITVNGKTKKVNVPNINVQGNNSRFVSTVSKKEKRLIVSPDGLAKQDAERKIFIDILNQLEKKTGIKFNPLNKYRGLFKGKIEVNSQAAPCEFCADIISKLFKNMFGDDIKVIVKYGADYTRPKSR